MADIRDDQALATLDEIAALIVREQTVESTLDVIVSLAGQLIDGVDAVGITLRNGDGWSTPASSNELAAEIDGKQYEENEGPCVSAVRDNHVFRVEDLANENRWPSFVRSAASSGVGSVLSLPLGPAGKAIAAMNFYSKRAHAFGGREQDAASMFARQAGTVLAGRQAFAESAQLIEQLREAVASRDVIGQAKGILMQRESVTAEEAFGLLRQASQNTNRKLRTVAEEIVKGVERSPRHD